ncbi:MAG: hypothetical protein KAG20_05590 [Cocleimonas sp.]|nr:hypothetical protein [Cocleimonas sp.]
MQIETLAKEKTRIEEKLFFSTDELEDGGYATDDGYAGVIEDFKTKMIYRCVDSIYWYRVVDEIFDIRVLRAFLGMPEEHPKDNIPADFQLMQELLGDVYFFSVRQHPTLSFIDIIRQAEEGYKEK